MGERGLRIGITALVLVLAIYLRSLESFDTDQVLVRLAGGQWGESLLFVLAYAVAVTLLIPTLPLNLGAGVLWGAGWGSALSVAGATLGATLAFLLTRFAASERSCWPTS